MPPRDAETRLRCWAEDLIVEAARRGDDASARFRSFGRVVRAAVDGRVIAPQAGMSLVSELYDALVVRDAFRSHPHARAHWFWLQPFGGLRATMAAPSSGRAWAPRQTLVVGKHTLVLSHVAAWDQGMSLYWRATGPDVDDLLEFPAPFRPAIDDRGRSHELLHAYGLGGDGALDLITLFATGPDARARELVITVGSEPLTLRLPDAAPLTPLAVRASTAEQAAERALLLELNDRKARSEGVDARRERAAWIAGLLAPGESRRWLQRFDSVLIDATSTRAGTEPWSAVAIASTAQRDRPLEARLVSGMSTVSFASAVVVVGPLVLRGGRLSTLIWTDQALTRWGHNLGEDPFDVTILLRDASERRYAVARRSPLDPSGPVVVEVVLAPAIEPGVTTLAVELEVSLADQVGTAPITLDGLS